MPLILLFVVLPVTELWLLLRVGAVVGPVPTIGLVILTGVVGASLARREGLKTLQHMMSATQRGEMPAAHMFDGLAIFLGGALLLTPGILTDIVGFSLLVPLTRGLLQRYMAEWFRKRMEAGSVVVHYAHHNYNPTDPSPPPPPPERIYDQTLDD